MSTLPKLKLPGTMVVQMDSISSVAADDAEMIVISGSHGGRSSGQLAAAVPLRAVFFNDAGGGKESAGVSGLELLQAQGIVAVAVGHLSARIGDAQDSWDHGVVTYVNECAVAVGISAGMTVQAAVEAVSSGAKGGGPRGERK